ncbi:MAG TPA: dTDP-4-amino-4,6-dideoxygalactose transaminase [Candidatus Dormibacteraeota bacterium]|nr:dTDP-4-amino-4,6-dideoxygalactose transaminase [Candidatus Dormibacteraeota bacterium]
MSPQSSEAERARPRTGASPEALPLRVPFNRAHLTGREVEYIAAAVANGHISGSGGFTRRCEEAIETLVPGRRALLTTSCTHALEMSALLLDLEPGDEVVVPSFTFVSTANAYALRGARPVFADVRADTLNIDERRLEGVIGPRTRAVVVVHYAGVGCEMDAILPIAERHGLHVVEDNAHGLFGTYRGRPLGSFGVMATQSFHETKNVTCGEGGALLVDGGLHDRALIVREKGTDRHRFLRGQVEKYTWVDVGSSYVMTDILAAFLLAQLESRAAVQDARRRIWERYDAALATWARAQGVERPSVPAHCEQAYHMYHLLLPDAARRGAFIDSLRRSGILAVFHYQPLHLSEMGRRLGGARGDCPVAEDVAERLVRLPFFTSMSDADLDLVIDAVTSIDLA